MYIFFHFALIFESQCQFSSIVIYLIAFFVSMTSPYTFAGLVHLPGLVLD